MLDYILLYPLLLFLRGVRRTMNTTSKSYLLISLPIFQPLLDRVGKLKAYEAYLRAGQTTPAYKQFLREQHHKQIKRLDQWKTIPVTAKENYVKKYTIEDRCQGGRIPPTGVVIDESSGSSGTPNNWVRSTVERRDVKRVMQTTLGLTFKEKHFFFLNCFALGPWATGMNVSMSVVDVGILKSIGPDKSKLENSLRQFGTRYHYIVTGYPPFIKDFVDTTDLKLEDYKMDLIVGGEGISEGLRDYLLKYFRTVRSSYGASDLEINIGAETDFAIALRRVLAKNSDACTGIFGTAEPPMIFQYDPLDYVIETNENKELIFTISRFYNAAPKIRYNIHDIGAVYTYKEMASKLAAYGLTVKFAQHSCFPFVCVYGRGDLTVPFYGAKIFTSDLHTVIESDERLINAVKSFQIKSFDDAQLNQQLEIRLEKSTTASQLPGQGELTTLLFEGLIRVNQDFREVSKLFTKDSIHVKVYDTGAGPFAGRDIRVKNNYIAARGE